MTQHSHTTEDCFRACAGYLGNLPEEYKKWKTLQDYRYEWQFVNSAPIREGLAYQEMSLDYYRSLANWLEPFSILGTMHKLLFIQGMASIYEAVLVDLWQNILVPANNSHLWEKYQQKKIERTSFAELIRESYKAELLNENWRDHIDDIRNKRNLIHLPNLSGQPNYSDGLWGTSFDQLSGNIQRFKRFIERRY